MIGKTPFDLNTMEVKGVSIPMVEGVMGRGMQSAISDSGTLIYMPGTMGGTGIYPHTLVWVDRNGNVEPIAAEPSVYFFPCNWDTLDGKRFLMIKPVSAQSASGGTRKINIVVNWFEELKQRVPTR